MYQIAKRISYLREKNQLTQAALAKKLGISRSAVNAWEMSLSVPSTQKIVELAGLFHVSTDYLLGLSDGMSVDISALDNEEREIVFRLVECFVKNKK